jgi:hypothetical protein
MLELILHRRFLGGDYTVGSLYLSPDPFPQGKRVDSQQTETDLQSTVLPPPLWGGVGGEVYFCDTLEDVDRGLTQSTPLDEIFKIKLSHETAIPTGVYKVIVTLSPAKKRMLPRLLDVPGFNGVLIHRGNTKHDSSGCILVGENKVKGRVIHSTYYEQRLVEILCEAQSRGEEIKITVMNQTAESEKPDQ